MLCPECVAREFGGPEHVTGRRSTPNTWLVLDVESRTRDSYTVVGASQVQSLAPSMLNTFPVNIHVQGGDVLGFWATAGAACSTFTGQAADVSPAGFGPQPAVGTTVTPLEFRGYRSNVSATLTPALPTAKDDCENGGWQSYDVFKNQGDCVSFVETGGKNPPADG